MYTPGAQDVGIRVRLRPEARWVAEYYVATDPVEEDDGNLVVTLPTGQVTWAARLLLRLGADAEVLEPDTVRNEVRVQARATLARYQG